jgi:hypothetical protein
MTRVLALETNRRATQNSDDQPDDLGAGQFHRIQHKRSSSPRARTTTVEVHSSVDSDQRIRETVYQSSQLD